MQAIRIGAKRLASTGTGWLIYESWLLRGSTEWMDFSPLGTLNWHSQELVWVEGDEEERQPTGLWLEPLGECWCKERLDFFGSSEGGFERTGLAVVAVAVVLVVVVVVF